MCLWASYDPQNKQELIIINSIKWLVFIIGKQFVFCMVITGNLRERAHLEDPGADGRIILRQIFRKWDVGARTGSSWLRIGTGGGKL